LDPSRARPACPPSPSSRTPSTSASTAGAAATSPPGCGRSLTSASS
jgi:hypothetical protein